MYGSETSGGDEASAETKSTKESDLTEEEQWMALELERMTMPDWDGYVKEEYLRKEG